MKRFLVQYDYGDGNLWVFVVADSKEQIEDRFRNVTVHSKSPDWLSSEMEMIIPTYPIESPGGWLELVLKT